MVLSVILGKFLDITTTDGDTYKVTPNFEETTKQPKSFVDAVNNVCDIPLSQLPKPCVKGDKWAIFIPEEEYQLGV